MTGTSPVMTHLGIGRQSTKPPPATAALAVKVKPLRASLT